MLGDDGLGGLNNAVVGNSLQESALRQEALEMQMETQYTNESFKYFKEMIDSVKEDIPDRLVKSLWVFGSTVFQLTNITTIDANILENKAALLILDVKRGTPRWSKTVQFLMDLEQIEMLFCAEIKKSVGGFERLAQITQIREGHQGISTQEMIPRAGILAGVGRLFGRR